VLDARFVVQRVAGSQRHPVRIAVLKTARRQQEVNFFGSVAVVGIAHFWREQRRADGDVVADLERGRRTDNRRIGVAFGPIGAGEGSARGADQPCERWLDHLEGARKPRALGTPIFRDLSRPANADMPGVGEDAAAPPAPAARDRRTGRRSPQIGFGSRKVFFEAVEKFLQCIASDGHLKMFLWLKSRRSSRP